MYSALDLRELTIKPKINDITLDTLREFYEFYLLPFMYTYTIKKDDVIRNIVLGFDKANFCHLLGVESIARGTVKNRNYIVIVERTVGIT